MIIKNDLCLIKLFEKIDDDFHSLQVVVDESV